ncbi:MAG: hypothetical protein GC145_08390 [Caulobacter sp.]|nr:hypothetical protein [Caulobacter sp.]
MRIFLIGAIALSSLAGVANAAAERQDGWLTLKDRTTRANLVIDGAVWSCKGDVCRAPRVKDLPPERACARLKAKLGEVTGFGYRGGQFDSDQLAACNAA